MNYSLFLIFISQILKDIYKRSIYLNLQRFGHFKCPSSGDNCCCFTVVNYEPQR